MSYQDTDVLDLETREAIEWRVERELIPRLTEFEALKQGRIARLDDRAPRMKTT